MSEPVECEPEVTLAFKVAAINLILEGLSHLPINRASMLYAAIEQHTKAQIDAHNVQNPAAVTDVTPK